jgi:hypothetical protein
MIDSLASRLLCFSGCHLDEIVANVPESDTKEATVIRWMMRVSYFVALLVIAQGALAQEFSAEVVNLKQSNVAAKKLYAGKDKVRVELEERNASFGPTALILDEAQRTPIALMTERHMYMEAPPIMAAPLVTQFWRVSDVNDACPQWKKAAEQSGTNKNWGSCTKVGSDSVNGRSAVKYEGVSSKGEKSYVWVDAKLRCVVKTDGGAGGIELRNIQEGSQPSSLFEIPAGYTRFDMGSMMKQPR